MPEPMQAVVILLQVLILFSLLYLLRRLTAGSGSAEVLARFEALDRALERVERGVREEIGRNREESVGEARAFRQEMTDLRPDTPAHAGAETRRHPPGAYRIAAYFARRVAKRNAGSRPAAGALPAKPGRKAARVWRVAGQAHGRPRPTPAPRVRRRCAGDVRFPACSGAASRRPARRVERLFAVLRGNGHQEHDRYGGGADRPSSPVLHKRWSSGSKRSAAPSRSA